MDILALSDLIRLICLCLVNLLMRILPLKSFHFLHNIHTEYSIVRTFSSSIMGNI